MGFTPTNGCSECAPAGIVKFVADRARQTVIKQGFRPDGSLGGTEVLEGCTVIDESNWTCTDKTMSDVFVSPPTTSRAGNDVSFSPAVGAAFSNGKLARLTTYAVVCYQKQ